MNTNLGYKPKLVDVFYKNKQKSHKHESNLKQFNKTKIINQSQNLQSLKQTSKYSSKNSNCTSLYEPSSFSPVTQRFQNIILKQNSDLKKLIHDYQKKSKLIDLKIKQITVQFINQMKFYKIPKKADGLIQNFLIQIVQQTQMLLQTSNFSSSLKINNRENLKNNDKSFDSISESQLNQIHFNKKRTTEFHQAIKQQQKDLQSTIRGQNKIDRISAEVMQSLSKRSINSIQINSQGYLQSEQSDIQSQGYQQRHQVSKFYKRCANQTVKKQEQLNQQKQLTCLSRNFWQSKYGKNIQYSQVISRKKIFQQRQ